MSLDRVDELGLRRWGDVGASIRRVLLGERAALFLSVKIPSIAECPFRRSGGGPSITRISLTYSSDITCGAYRSAVRASGYRRSVRRLFYRLESAKLGVDL